MVGAAIKMTISLCGRAGYIGIFQRLGRRPARQILGGEQWR